jgi:hypothetical protein
MIFIGRIEGGYTKEQILEPMQIRGNKKALKNFQHGK